MMRELDKLKFSVGGTLLDGLKAINDSGIEIAFVVDKDDRVIGTLTDGDVRRALLADTSLTERVIESIMRRDFTAVSPSSSRTEVLDLMRARGISQIPVLDEQGQLVSVHLLGEMIGAVARPNWAVVMAGGRGSRLEPLTDGVPKPMLRVAGRPILERLILHLVGHGIQTIYLAVNYRREVIKNHFGDGSELGCDIRYIEEEEPLGTGGALSRLPKSPDHAMLVLNGDLVTEFNIGRALETHEQHGHDLTVGIRPYAVKIPYGVADVRDGRVVTLREKPTERILINAGIYVVSPGALERIPQNERYDMTQLVDDLIEASASVGAHLLEGDWIDVGHHEELTKARGQE